MGGGAFDPPPSAPPIDFFLLLMNIDLKNVFVKMLRVGYRAVKIPGFWIMNEKHVSHLDICLKQKN